MIRIPMKKSSYPRIDSMYAVLKTKNKNSVFWSRAIRDELESMNTH